MLEEILKKQTVDDNDIKILIENQHLLSETDLVRFGFKEATPDQTTVEELVTTEEVIVEPKKRGRRKIII